MSKTSFTVAEASAATGKSTKTIYRWIKSGKVSSHKDKDGKQRIDMSELSRVADIYIDKSGQLRPQESDIESNGLGHKKELEKELEGMKRLLAEKDLRIAELKEDKDRLQLLLEDNREGKREEKNKLGFLSRKLSELGL